MLRCMYTSECGPQYTSKMEAMLSDIKLSQELMQKMREVLSKP